METSELFESSEEPDLGSCYWYSSTGNKSWEWGNNEDRIGHWNECLIE